MEESRVRALLSWHDALLYHLQTLLLRDRVPSLVNMGDKKSTVGRLITFGIS